MNFCPWCGTRVVGAYCIQCGAGTSADSLATSTPPPVTTSTSQVAAEGEHVPVNHEVTAKNASSARITSVVQGPERRSLVRETRWVMVAFLVPGVVSAVLVLAEHISGVGDIARFATIVRGHPLTNMFLGILAYLPVAAVVPLGLFLLGRTGQDRHALGLEAPTISRDVIPGLGLGLAAFGCEIVLVIILRAILIDYPGLFVNVSLNHIPKYYVVWGIATSAVTAVTEEILVNGYLLTRLNQLGWNPRAALILSLILRTSYHIYYGIGFIFTVPFGYFVTRSFQKNGKLMRPIMAHFLYDAILFTIVILH
ncbi:MAG: CPBP family intramembrane glutamic endopeptidase [Acidimicrobiales bacterium]